MALGDLDANKLADLIPAHEREQLLQAWRHIAPLTEQPQLVEAMRKLIAKLHELHGGQPGSYPTSSLSHDPGGSASGKPSGATGPVIANQATDPSDPAAQTTAPANAKQSIPPSRGTP